MTVEDNDEILYTNIYKQYISNLKKIKLKNNKDEVIARLMRRSSYWKRKRYYHQISALITFCEKTYQISRIIYCKRLRENWTRGSAHTECPGGGGDIASACSRLLPPCSNVIQVTEKFPCGFRQIISQESQKLQFSPTFKLLKKWRANSSATLSCQNVYKSKTFPFTFGARALIFELIFLPPEDFKNKHVRGSKTKRNNNSTSSLRTADAFPVVASLPQLRK